MSTYLNELHKSKHSPKLSIVLYLTVPKNLRQQKMFHVFEDIHWKSLLKTRLMFLQLNDLPTWQPIPSGIIEAEDTRIFGENRWKKNASNIWIFLNTCFTFYVRTLYV